jgi:hypothetical protein
LQNTKRTGAFGRTAYFRRKGTCKMKKLTIKKAWCLIEDIMWQEVTARHDLATDPNEITEALNFEVLVANSLHLIRTRARVK